MLPVKKEEDVPTLEAVRGLFETWRKGKKPRDPIPAALWDAVITLAGRHSVYEIARGLRLNYNGLKARMEARPDDVPSFIEIGALPATVEMTKPTGEKMRIAGAFNVAELVRIFLG